MIGSVKTNLGHSEAVSGIASIIKVSLALERELIPPTIGIKQPNPELKLAERNIKVVTDLTPWPSETIQRASINSFGYGGANAHVIMESANTHVPTNFLNTLRPDPHHLFILPFSTFHPDSLVNNVEAILASPIVLNNLADLTYTLGCRRTAFQTRAYILASQDSFQKESLSSSLRTLRSPPRSLPLGFIFTGQGAQWPGMGCELLERFPIYRQTIRMLDACLASLPDPPSWTLESKLTCVNDEYSLNFHIREYLGGR